MEELEIEQILTEEELEFLLEEFKKLNEKIDKRGDLYGEKAGCTAGKEE